MSNKQSSVEWLHIEFQKRFPKETYEMYNSNQLAYEQMILQAKAMHKEECIKYYVDSTYYGDMGQHIRESLIQIAEKIYNKTFEE